MMEKINISLIFLIAIGHYVSAGIALYKGKKDIGLIKLFMGLVFLHLAMTKIELSLINL